MLAGRVDLIGQVGDLPPPEVIDPDRYQALRLQREPDVRRRVEWVRIRRKVIEGVIIPSRQLQWSVNPTVSDQLRNADSDWNLVSNGAKSVNQDAFNAPEHVAIRPDPTPTK